MEKAKDFYSKTVADAIRQACAEFATSQEKLDIEVVETGSAGIFGLCRKRAHIRVTPKKPAVSMEEISRKAKADQERKEQVPAEKQRSEERARPDRPAESEEENERRGKKPVGKTAKIEAAAPEKGKEAPPVEPPGDEILASVRADLDEVLQLMGFPSTVVVSFEGGSIQCRISGEFEDAVIGEDGRTLDSLQYLLRKMAGRVLSDRVMIDLDAGNFRERRKEELRSLAMELAEQVKEDGKTRSIPAMNPSERRVVHVTLQDDKGIRSRSVGEGLFKKVLIYRPGSKAKKGGGRRRGRQGGRTTEE
ncbi:MAG: hypothetical protein Kow0089_08810 [Desulfobulbaceae bacterium]